MVRDLEGVIQFWNSGAEELYGWRREEVLGKNVNDVLRTQAAQRKWQLADPSAGRWTDGKAT